MIQWGFSVQRSGAGATGVATAAVRAAVAGNSSQPSGQRRGPCAQPVTAQAVATANVVSVAHRRQRRARMPRHDTGARPAVYHRDPGEGAMERNPYEPPNANLENPWAKAPRDAGFASAPVEP